MRGTIVVARLYDGSAAVLRVWEFGSEAIYLSEESQFQRLMRGESALSPVGFPKDDVFTYNPSYAEQVSSNLLDWKKLSPIGGTPTGDAIEL